MDSPNEMIEWLQSWINSQNKENRLTQVIIMTIDNPGWGMSVDMGKQLTQKKKLLADFEKGENDWYYCTIENGKFEGDGGLFNLKNILFVFRSMFDDKLKQVSVNDDFKWLQQWFADQCDGDWEHGNGVKIGTLDNPGWYLSISLKDTECEGRDFKPITIERSKNDWFHCFVRDGRFEGPCGPFNFPEVLQIFRKWAENCAKDQEY